MATKTITITQEAYDILKSKKEENDSFSKAIVKLAGKKSLTSFYGILNSKSVNNLEKSIFDSRKIGRIKHQKRIKNDLR